MRALLILSVVALLGWASPAAAYQVELKPAALRDLGAIVRDSGHSCPVAKRLDRSGEDARGPVYILHCAAATDSPPLSWWAFRVWFPPAGGMTVEPA